MIFLTLLKLGAPSVCGASFTSLSMPSKWSVIALHVEMSAILMLLFSKNTMYIKNNISQGDITNAAQQCNTFYIPTDTNILS